MHRSVPAPSAATTIGRLAGLFDRRLLAWAAVWTVPALVGFGVVTAIIPSPIFVRLIPPEPFAIAVWLISAPLMGLVLATYTARPRPSAAVPLDAAAMQEDPGRGSTLGTVGGVLAFLAIGCPICNKIALVLLGTSGAMTFFAPLQPLIGAASIVLLVATLAWRLRLRARGAACAVPG
jgi:hypothetical protein